MVTPLRRQGGNMSDDRTIDVEQVDKLKARVAELEAMLAQTVERISGEKTHLQRAIIVLEDTSGKCLQAHMEFIPVLTDDTRSHAASMACKMMEMLSAESER
jgi:ABC-type phosphate transport system auxiliary subunit